MTFRNTDGWSKYGFKTCEEMNSYIHLDETGLNDVNFHEVILFFSLILIFMKRTSLAT